MQLGGINSIQQGVNQHSVEKSEQQKFKQKLEKSQGVMDDVPGVASQSGDVQVDDGKEALEEAAEGMEGLFVNLLVKQMRKTVPDNKLLDGGQGGKMFREQLDKKYANLIAREKDFGIASAIYDQLSGQISKSGNS
ncbi:MAG: rod-binding protein [bacterium]